MKYGLIGCGRISPNHIQAAIDNNLIITALCDIEKNKATNLISKFNLDRNKVKIYTDYKEMIKKEKLDLVGIATESGKHAAIALDCIKAKCNLIIEKPIALSLNDVDKIIEAAKLNKVVVSSCHQNRFNKSILRIRKALEEGKFGRMLYGTAHIRWNRGPGYYQQATWRGTWEQDGGALMNQCIHNIDILIWMMNSEIEEVYAYTDRLCHDYIEAEDFGIAVIKFKNGSYGIIEGTTNIYPANLEETLYLFGEKGTVKAGGKSVNIIEEWAFADSTNDAQEVKELYSEFPDNIYGFGHNSLYKDVIKAIKNNGEPYITIEDGKKALEVVLGIYKSAATGKPVKFPLKNIKTTDFKGRFEK